MENEEVEVEVEVEVIQNEVEKVVQSNVEKVAEKVVENKVENEIEIENKVENEIEIENKVEVEDENEKDYVGQKGLQRGQQKDKGKKWATYQQVYESTRGWADSWRSACKAGEQARSEHKCCIVGRCDAKERTASSGRGSSYTVEEKELSWAEGRSKEDKRWYRYGGGPSWV
jgi:hypothetical protein